MPLETFPFQLMAFRRLTTGVKNKSCSFALAHDLKINPSRYTRNQTWLALRQPLRSRVALRHASRILIYKIKAAHQRAVTPLWAYLLYGISEYDRARNSDASLQSPVGVTYRR